MPLLSSSRRALAAFAAVLSLGLLSGCAEDADPTVDTVSSGAADPTPTRGASEASEDIPSPSDSDDTDEAGEEDEGRAGSAATGTASAMLAELTVKGRAPKTGYDGDLFKWRADTDHNGCDTRNDVLRRDLTTITLKAGTHGCIVLAGTLDDPYAGETYDFDRSANAVDIDHVVARSNAWQTGAFKFDDETLKEFGNDPLNLLAVSSSLNRQKGDGDAATWLPPNKSFRCEYVARQIAVKHKYELWVVPAEKAAMERVLAKCDDQPAFAEDVDWPGPGDGDNVTTKEETRPAKQKSSSSGSSSSSSPGSSSSGTTSGSSSSSGSSSYFENCTAAREAGAAPVHRGDPGYGSHLDRDGDGVGCE
ncbi:GmrSD restriction endonuclease domain-containing protein [Brevibacterium sediminis]|uniref:GmrSD restriction endonuclease domain-containing protein n=1 Tax=Brevibacterium sediminis TaxID=1857024 RepID=UPI0036708A68